MFSLVRCLMLVVSFCGYLAIAQSGFAQTGTINDQEVVREWVDDTGEHRIRAVFIELRKGEGDDSEIVVMRRVEDNKNISVPLARLSAVDQKYIEENLRPRKKSLDEDKSAVEPSGTTKTKNSKAEDKETANKEGDAKGPLKKDENPKNAKLSSDGNGTGDRSTTPSVIVPAKPPKDSGAGSAPKSIVPVPPPTESTLPPESGDSKGTSQPPIARDIIPFGKPDASGDSGESGKPLDSSPAKQVDRDDSAADTQQAMSLSEAPSANGDGSNSSATKSRTGGANSSERLDVIGSAAISVREIPDSPSWADMTDDQLAGLIQLSAGLETTQNQQASQNLGVSANVPVFNLGLRGTGFLSDVYRIGFFKFDRLRDEAGVDHSAQKYSPRIRRVTNAWVFPDVTLPRDPLQPIQLSVDLKREKTRLQNIDQASGQFRVAAIEKGRIIEIENIASNGGTLDTQLTRDKGLDIRVLNPDQTTIVVQISGQTEFFADTVITGCSNRDFGMGRLMLGENLIYQFNFRESVPETANLEIRIVDKYREITVPFSFRDVTSISAGR